MLSEEKEALIGRVFQTYLTEHHKEDILQLIANTYDESHHPVFVNAMTLFEASMEVTITKTIYCVGLIVIIYDYINLEQYEHIILTWYNSSVKSRDGMEWYGEKSR